MTRGAATKGWGLSWGGIGGDKGLEWGEGGE